MCRVSKRAAVKTTAIRDRIEFLCALVTPSIVFFDRENRHPAYLHEGEFSLGWGWDSPAWWVQQFQLRGRENEMWSKRDNRFWYKVLCAVIDFAVILTTFTVATWWLALVVVLYGMWNFYDGWNRATWWRR